MLGRQDGTFADEDNLDNPYGFDAATDPFGQWPLSKTTTAGAQTY